MAVLLVADAVAVIAALCVIEMLAAFAVNPTVDWLAGTVTEDGTVTFALLLFTATGKPLPDAFVFSETVQVDEPGVATFVGEQDNPLNATDMGVLTAILPPVPVAATVLPSPAAAERPANCTATVLSAGVEAILKVTLATVPDPMAVVFSPDMTQTVLALVPLHDNVFDAAVAAAPALTVTPLISVAG